MHLTVEVGALQRPSGRRGLGQVFTPRYIARMLVRWAVRRPSDRVLDPGCGDGVFLAEAYARLAELGGPVAPGQLVGVEVDAELAERAKRTPGGPLVIAADFFDLAPERLGRFDAVVGNPPYVAWKDLPAALREKVSEMYGRVAKRYGLGDADLYAYWIVHATRFLREGGRLAMIVSDAWLQSRYGVGLLRLLLDRYKVRAVVDIGARVFDGATVGASIILAERSSDAVERALGTSTFVYLEPPRGRPEAAEEALSLVGRGRPGAAKAVRLPSSALALVRAYRQGELYGFTGKPVALHFDAGAAGVLARSPYAARLSEYFDVMPGNTVWAYLARRRARGASLGGRDFFCLTEADAARYGIPREFLHPLLPSPSYARFFAFTHEDWEGVRRSGGRCYILIAHRPREELPEPVRRYVELGERESGVGLARGKNRGRPVAESDASRMRERTPALYGWYDLGGVVETPAYVARSVQYWVRFILAEYGVALTERMLALLPRRPISRAGLKALLAFLNSSFGQLQAELLLRSTGGGMLDFDIKPLGEFLVPDVARLPEEAVERLARLFDDLEAEARRLGGADRAANLFGPGGLLHTVIKEVDLEVERALGLPSAAGYVRALALALMRRRLARAKLR